MSVITVPILFKFGGFPFPTDFIKIDTFDISPNQRQDLDSYTDAFGETHRNAIPCTKTQIKFKTRQLRNREFDYLMSGIVGAYDDALERMAGGCEYWDFEYNKMRTGRKMYLDPSVHFKLVNLIPQNASDRQGGEIYLIDEIDWIFIEYGHRFNKSDHYGPN